MHHEQSGIEAPHAFALRLRGDVVEELAPHAERAAADLHGGLALLFDPFAVLGQQVRDMCRVGRRADRHDGLHFGDLVGCRDHRRAAEAVPDEQSGCGERPAKMIRCPDEVGDVGAERRVGELAVRLAEPREVEPEYRDVEVGQCPRDTRGGDDVLAAGEAVCEQRHRPGRAGGQVEPSGEVFASRATERHALALDHGPLLSCGCAQGTLPPSWPRTPSDLVDLSVQHRVLAV